MRERRDAKKFEAQSNPPISGESVAELKVDGIQPVVTLPKVPIFLRTEFASALCG